MKDFPAFAGKILPAALLLSLLNGCHTSTTLAEAGSTRHPVVAPAGTVLRVRLNQALDTGRSRPGDRFLGALDSPLVADGIVILPKGAAVEGQVVEAYQPPTKRSFPRRPVKPAELALALDFCERGGRTMAVSATAATRTTGHHPASLSSDILAKGTDRILLPADAVVGFTLREPISDSEGTDFD